jgi:hypothetical protein
MNVNYNRMPGFGDLPGDNNNPNSPDYIEPSYGEDDAECDVAAQLVAADEVGALVSDVRGSLAFLAWVAGQDIPDRYLPGFRNLDRQARSLDRAVDTLIEREQRDAA